MIQRHIVLTICVALVTDKKMTITKNNNNNAVK